MNKLFLFAFGLFFLAIASCNSGSDNVKLESKLDSASYALGVSIGSNLERSGMTEINGEVFIAALKKALAKDSNLLINDENANIILQKFFQDIQVEKGKKTLEEGEKWLKENAKKEGVVTTASGLQYKILTEGTGAKPLATDKVSVHYHGTLIDGTVFDSSVERGQPVEFTVSGVIPGWTEALLLMPIGSKWEIYIPASLGYGERGAGGVIPGNATLIFQVELLSIVPVVEEKPENGKK